MTSADLIIFDCDGVLVDSEPIANRVFCDMLNDLGLAISLDETIREFVGRSMASCMAIVAARIGRPAPADFLERFHERTFAEFRASLAPVPGIVGVLDALDAAGQRYCVASSGEHRKMQLTLGLTNLLPRFAGRIFSAQDVAHGKPAPDLFLHAARSLGAEPSRCVVVEDSPIGAQAGVAAGMRVYGYAARSDRDRLTQAGAIVFDDMHELIPLLEQVQIVT